MDSVMHGWIRKVKFDNYSMRVTIPAFLVKDLGWESCQYVVVKKFLNKGLIIGRMPGDGNRDNEGPKRAFNVD